MAWTRVYQLTAEHRVLTDLDNQGGATQQPTISSAQAHAGTYSYLLNGQPVAFGITIPTPRSRVRVGYWLRHGGLGNERVGYLYLAAVSKTQYEGANIGIRIDGVNGNIEVVRPVSGTTNAYETLYAVAIPSSLSLIDTWLHIGVYHFADELNGVLRLYVNGALLVNWNGDTRLYGQGSGTPVFSTAPSYVWVAGAYLGSGNNLDASTYVDDFYIETSTDESAASIPARSWDAMTPNGAGTNAEWTPLASTNVSNIDDNPNDGDTTYNKALATALKDNFAFTNVIVPSDHTIVAMIPTIFVKRLDTATDVQVRLLAYDGLTYKNGADQVPALDYSLPLFERMTTQPDTTAWNETDANAAEFGYESRGTYA